LILDVQFGMRLRWSPFTRRTWRQSRWVLAPLSSAQERNNG
jgi:hypothetical protein